LDEAVEGRNVGRSTRAGEKHREIKRKTKSKEDE
jgi:hypothetical protein